MNHALSLSVVLPLYRTRASVPELIDRLSAAVSTIGHAELVFVDDCCPERSYEAVSTHRATGTSIVVYRHDRNGGQHAAVITGLAVARGELVAVMDADLQDAPEDLPKLVERLQTSSGAVDAVAAGRRGRYETRFRELTGRLFRRAVHRLTSGRVAPDASMFLVMTASARDRVLALRDPAVHLVAALGRVGAHVESLPIERHVRPRGSSSYRTRERVRIAVRAVAVLTPLYSLLRRAEPRAPVLVLPEDGLEAVTREQP